MSQHVQRTKTEFTDIAGVTHQVVITCRDGRYTARTFLTESFGSGGTPEEALQNLVAIINDNRPEQFNLAAPEKQKKLVEWIIENLRVGTPGKSRRYHSYHLKHIAEYCIGRYVSNGEMKGAMQNAGFKPTKDTNEYDMNWMYVLQRGLGTLRGEIGCSLSKRTFERLTQSLPKINEMSAEPPVRQKSQSTKTAKIVRHKPSLGPLECAHCHLIWYGTYCDNQNHTVVPPGITLCTSCWYSLENHLYGKHAKLYKCADEDSDDGMRLMVELHSFAKDWIFNKNQKPLPKLGVKRFHKSVPKWIRSAIDQGMVKTNSQEVYIISDKDNIATSVELSDKARLR